MLKSQVNDNLSFGINGGNQLVVAGKLNFEEKNSYRVTVIGIDQEGNRIENSFDIDITSVAEPSIAPSVESIDFGLTDICRGGSEKSFDVLNDGPDGVLEISSIELPDGFSISPDVATISPGESLTFTLTFDPEIEGEVEEDLKLISNAGESIINITGEAQLVAGLEELPSVSDQVEVYPIPANDRLTVNTQVFNNQPFNFHIIDLSSGHIKEVKENVQAK